MILGTAVLIALGAVVPQEHRFQGPDQLYRASLIQLNAGLGLGPRESQDSSSHTGWLGTAASAVLPGTGQLLNNQDRGLIYLAAEMFLLIRYFSSRSEGNRERDRFHDLAFTVARASFSPTVRDTVFEYFEEVSKFVASGPFDMDPGPGFTPPTDEKTFNGQIWALARQTFFADADDPPAPESEEFLRALEFYRDRAIGPNFSWSWQDAELQRDFFRQSIRDSDAAFRRATQQLGLVLVNHLLSTVDAFISQRISRRRRLAHLDSRVWQSTVAGRGLRADLRLRLSF